MEQKLTVNPINLRAEDSTQDFTFIGCKNSEECLDAIKISSEEARIDTIPDSSGFHIYDVYEAGVYQNFIDSNKAPINVTQEDIDDGIVHIWVNNGVSEKITKSIDFKLPILDFDFFSNTHFNSKRKAIKIGNIWTNILSEKTGESLNYQVVDKWMDGSPMDEKKTDGIIYRKRGNEYLKLVFDKVIKMKWINTSNILTTEMFILPNSTYEIEYDYNLNGATLNIPNNCTIRLLGSITGGTINLNNAVIEGDTNLLKCRTSGFFGNDRFTITNSEFGAYHLQSVKKGATAILGVDISTNIAIDVRCSIDGENHTINELSPNTKLLSLKEDNITLFNLKITNKLTIELKHGQAIYANSINNLVLDRCYIEGGIELENNCLSLRYGVSIRNCYIYCDFSDHKQDSLIQYDALFIRGIKHVTIEDTRIICKNVNRVIKTQDIPNSPSYPAPCPYVTEYLTIRNCYIESHSINGKQVWDMFNGTTNVLFENNKVVSSGHTNVFENKTNFPNATSGTMTFRQNVVEYTGKLGFFDSMIDTQGIIIEDNRFIDNGDLDTFKHRQNGEDVNIERAHALEIRSFDNLQMKGNVFQKKGEASKPLSPICTEGSFTSIEISKNQFESMKFINITSAKNTKSVIIQGNTHTKHTDHILNLIEANIGSLIVDKISTTEPINIGIKIHQSEIQNAYFSTMNVKFNIFTITGVTSIKHLTSEGFLLKKIPITTGIVKAGGSNYVGRWLSSINPEQTVSKRDNILSYYIPPVVGFTANIVDVESNGDIAVLFTNTLAIEAVKNTEIWVYKDKIQY